MSEDDAEIPAAKVVLLGETGVGKTSIINSFLKKAFSSSVESTPGASFVAKTFILSNDQEIKFEIWDTAGQEKFRAITKLFYKNASIVIMVYDITRMTTFEELKRYWYGAIKTNAGNNTLLAVVANKSDMYNIEEVPEKSAKEYAQSINAIFKETSAKSSEGIDDLFKTLGLKYLNPTKYDEKLAQDDKKKHNNQQKITLNKPKEESKNKKCQC